jgi:hypothetical protein
MAGPAGCDTRRKPRSCPYSKGAGADLSPIKSDLSPMSSAKRPAEPPRRSEERRDFRLAPDRPYDRAALAAMLARQ